jgi:3-hydroxybutyryl-CoA dehydrogenase
METGAGNPRQNAISVVGVVGLGVIGSSLTQALAQTGHRVIAVDVDEAACTRAEKAVRRGLRLHSLVAGGEPQPVEEMLARIAFDDDLNALAAAEFVIENVTESWDVKRALYGRLDEMCAPPCPLAANTSAIPITKIGSATTSPSRVLGIHFMNPVPLKRAAEVIRGFHTSEQTFSSALCLLGQLGVRPIEVRDSPGFVANRVLMLSINEAAFLVHEGVASAPVVDDVFTQCFGHPMGPLATADLIGLDTILLSIEVLQQEYGDDKYRPCPLLRSLVSAGLLGRKSGRGFHDYAGETTDRGAAAERRR